MQRGHLDDERKKVVDEGVERLIPHDTRKRRWWWAQVGQCENVMCNRRRVRRTTTGLLECRSFRDLRRSYEVHSPDSAVPVPDWVPASTPADRLLPLASAAAPPVVPARGSGGGGTDADSLDSSGTSSSASPGAGAGSTAALRDGGRAPTGGLGAEIGCVHAGGLWGAVGLRGSGNSIVSSSSSGAGAPGLMPAVESRRAARTAPRS